MSSEEKRKKMLMFVEQYVKCHGLFAITVYSIDFVSVYEIFCCKKMASGWDLSISQGNTSSTFALLKNKKASVATDSRRNVSRMKKLLYSLLDMSKDTADPKHKIVILENNQNISVVYTV